MKKHKYKIDVVVINPVSIFGPLLTKQDNHWNKFILNILNGTFPGVPENLYVAVVDVRDVAEAHIKAMLIPQVKGKRIIVSNKRISFAEIVDILRQQFEKYGYSIPSKTVTYEELQHSENEELVGFTRLTAWFRNPFIVNNKRSIEELKMQYRNVDETMTDTAYSIIELGLVENKLI